MICLYVLLAVVLLYFLAIMPQMKKPASILNLKDHHYAHRGLYNNSTEAPENSLPAFQLAAHSGYGIELDVQLTKDRIPVVFHDFNLKRACGVDAKVSQLSFQELRSLSIFHSNQIIPSLLEVLQLVKGRVPLIIEYKVELMDTGVCAITDRLLQGYNGVYCIESFNPLALCWYRKHRPDIVRGQLSSNFAREGKFSLVTFCIQMLLFNFLTKPAFIAYNYLDKNELSRTLCHSLFRSLSVAWTIDSKEIMEKNKKNFDLFIFEGFLP